MSRNNPFCARTEAYEDVKPLLKSIVSRYRKTFGGNTQELISAVNFGFSIAYEQYKPERGTKFATHVHYMAQVQILAYYRLRGKLKRIKCEVDIAAGRPVEEDTPGYMASIPNPEERFSVPGFTALLSPAAKFLVESVINMTVPLRMEVMETGRPTPKNIRESLIPVGLEAGFTLSEIAKAFQEIAEALES